MTPSLKVLVSAYACEPEKGSEPGVGWNWVKQIARFHEVWAITRANNRPAIEKAMIEGPLPNVHWIYFDLPPWARFWKRGQRGAHFYYYLWQIGAYFVGRHLHRDVGFDLVHHVTIVNYWLPSFLAMLPVPFLWGPVGGGDHTPKLFYKTFSRRGKMYEYLRRKACWIGEHDPFVLHTARRARMGFATTPETAKRLKKLGCQTVELLPQVALSHDEITHLAATPLRYDGPFRLVSMGRLLHLKGFHLGLMAFARFQQRFPHSEYWFIGDGAEHRKLERLAQRLGVEEKVHFWGNLPRHQALQKLAACDALVHPSLHESGALVCLEAMAAGRPVICLDLGGPALQMTDETGFKLSAISPDQVLASLTEAMFQLAHDPGRRASIADAARKRVAQYFDWNQKGELIARRYITVRRGQGR
jgi:glycosyltransferase involved in cell wall biosynthesis